MNFGRMQRMIRRRVRVCSHSLIPVLAACLIIWGFPVEAVCQSEDSYWRAHNQGNLSLTLEVAGWGDLPSNGEVLIPYYDPITGDSVYGCSYPRGSRHKYFLGDLVIGAVSGRDTIATWFFSAFWHDPYSLWHIRSSDPTSPYYSADARSSLDLVGEFTDTTQINIWWMDWKRQLPVPLQIIGTQKSMAWSGGLIDDFVLFDYEITNVGTKPLKDVWIGVWAGSYWQGVNAPPADDLTGYLRDWVWPDNCETRELMNIAYYMDNDGDPLGGTYTSRSRNGAVGIMLLDASSDSVAIGYNWYVWNADRTQDWGPRPEPTVDEPWRSFNPYFARPGSYENLYYIMSHPNIAYDQMFAGVAHSEWQAPVGLSKLIATGWPSDMYYYFGPFEIGVHEKVNFTWAIVAGDNVHTDPYMHLDPDEPQLYYNTLDFSELATNAQWAKWVYDNPGVDTDSDGYFGEYRVCEGETTWYKGDGVPDYRGTMPPPIPFTRYETESGKIIVRWNGYLSETTKDNFSGLYDFEGYRVFCGLDDRLTSLSIMTSYDKQNWFRWKYKAEEGGAGRWINDAPPFSLDSLRALHHDSTFTPDVYPRQRPLYEGDSVFYFEAVDNNMYSLTDAHGIHKAFPDAVNPGTDSTLWTDDDVTTEHDGRRLPKYYEYEYVIDNLLPTVPYFVALTVFDFGFAGGRGNLPPDETSPLNNVAECYAQTSSEVVEELQLDAYVYPNPYRADANYEDNGYENRKSNIIPDRARLIHFGNLPKVCKIKIYSLDGDHIGTIDHSFPEGGPESMHDWWNLVSRSGLAVESGLYYWVVESADRTQIGKLVILK
jgi:hypothetical protein